MKPWLPLAATISPAGRLGVFFYWIRPASLMVGSDYTAPTCPKKLYTTPPSNSQSPSSLAWVQRMQASLFMKKKTGSFLQHFFVFWTFVNLNYFINIPQETFTMKLSFTSWKKKKNSLTKTFLLLTFPVSFPQGAGACVNYWIRHGLELMMPGQQQTLLLFVSFSCKLYSC